MSGHSKWATIKHKKAATDAKRGKSFTRLIKEITVAARTGGGDPEGNPRLRAAVNAAKAENMPAENIKRAIQRGTGELPGVTYEEASYEGYGPHGVAMMVEVATDNRNRTVSEIRHLFSRHGGSLGEAGCVSWMFSKQGSIIISKQNASEEQLLNIVLDAGAEDLRDDGEQWEIVCTPPAVEGVSQALKDAGVGIESAETAMLPQTYVKLEGKNAEQMIRFVEALEEHEDVQHVYSNFDIDQRELEQVSGG
ncbi:MAG: YebC/PmpR family DNA-binding transcriptional regulator [Acidobacteria bacterium]|nr:YebC/PmpR family DNA-binding transcriptional regulator [Acidobacteriota bacterium]